MYWVRKQLQWICLLTSKHVFFYSYLDPLIWNLDPIWNSSPPNPNLRHLSISIFKTQHEPSLAQKAFPVWPALFWELIYCIHPLHLLCFRPSYQCNFCPLQPNYLFSTKQNEANRNRAVLPSLMHLPITITSRLQWQAGLISSFLLRTQLSTHFLCCGFAIVPPAALKPACSGNSGPRACTLCVSPSSLPFPKFILIREFILWFSVRLHQPFKNCFIYPTWIFRISQ